LSPAEPLVEFAGETVTVSAVSDPGVSYGSFRLESRGSAPVRVQLSAAWLELGDERRVLETVSLFDTGTDEPIDPAGFKLELGEALTFLAGFPRVPLQPRPGEPVAVALRLIVEGAGELEAVSPVELVHRIPPGA
jgi:hypothetical protein